MHHHHHFITSPKIICIYLIRSYCCLISFHCRLQSSSTSSKELRVTAHVITMSITLSLSPSLSRSSKRTQWTVDLKRQYFPIDNAYCDVCHDCGSCSSSPPSRLSNYTPRSPAGTGMWHTIAVINNGEYKLYSFVLLFCEIIKVRFSHFLWLFFMETTQRSYKKWLAKYWKVTFWRRDFEWSKNLHYKHFRYS